MSDALRICYALTASVFAAIFLIAVIVYGGEHARNAAIASALFGCYSQFTAQDTNAWKPSIYLAYISFALGVFAFLMLFLGK